MGNTQQYSQIHAPPPHTHTHTPRLFKKSLFPKKTALAKYSLLTTYICWVMDQWFSWESFSFVPINSFNSFLSLIRSKIHVPSRAQWFSQEIYSALEFFTGSTENCTQAIHRDKDQQLHFTYFSLFKVD